MNKLAIPYCQTTRSAVTSMNTNMKQFLFWIPRVLCILFALFLSMFSLDVFSEGYGFGETILALLTHLLPAISIIILLIIAWRWERVGAILCISLSLFLLLSSGGESWFISLPLFLTGLLFLLSWKIQHMPKAVSKTA